jgi:hypothetical protein
MRLSLSSAALPGADLAGLLEACERRGLGGLELVAGEGPLPDHRGVAAAGFPDALAAAGVALTGIHVADPVAAASAAAARLSRALDVPVVAPLSTTIGTPLPVLLEVYGDEGGRLLLCHCTHLELVTGLRGALDVLDEPRVGLAWEIVPGEDDPAAVARLVETVGGRLEYVRLRGGGPEAAAQTGLGVGPLVASLARARYAGPLVLLPSTPAYRRAWGAWLGRGGGWGCGSRSPGAPLALSARPSRTPTGTRP